MPESKLPHKFMFKGLAASVALGAVFSAGNASTARLNTNLLATNKTGTKHIASAGLAYSSKDSQKSLPEDSLPTVLKQIAKLSPDEQKSKLREICASQGESETNRREAAYVLARLLQKSTTKDDDQEALKLYQEASKIEPLWERCQWHISECAQVLGQEKAVRQALELIKLRSTNTDSKANADYGLAQSYLRANESDRAKEAFATIRSEYPHSSFSLGSAYYLGEMFIDSKEGQKEALGLFREYMKRSPDGHFAITILKRITALKDYEPTEYDHGIFGKVQYANGNWQDALEEWSKGPSANYWYAEAVCLNHLGKQVQAIDILQSGIKDHPTDSQIPEAASYLCRLLTKDQAIAVWQSILDAGPKYADIALFNLGTRAADEQAVAYFKELIDKYPHSYHASEACWWLVWNQIKQNNFHQAAEMAKVAIDKYPGAKIQSRFAFWCGKLHEKLKSQETAKLFYKRATTLGAWTYYGHRAQARLAALSGKHDPGWSTQPGRNYAYANWNWPELPKLVSYADIAKKEGATVAILCKLGQWDECLQVLPAKSNPLVRSLIYANLNLPLDAIASAAIELSGSPKKTGLWVLGYPLLYANQVNKDSQDNRIDPLLVHGLIREESRYNAMATSHSNAIGLMQLMPATAFGVAKHMGLTIGSNDDIYKPDNNIALGTHYIAYLLDRFSNNALAAVAGYNGGPNAVAKWLQGQTDMDVFVENIPTTETRDYVRKVFAAFWNYQAIYAPQAQTKS